MTLKQWSSDFTWMRIFPKEMNGVLNSVVNRQPTKKSPSPLLKNWGVRLFNECVHVEHNNHMVEHKPWPCLPEWWAWKQSAGTDGGGPASTPSLGTPSGCPGNDCYRCHTDLWPSQCDSGSNTLRRCQKPYRELQAIQTHSPTSDWKKKQSNLQSNSHLLTTV